MLDFASYLNGEEGLHLFLEKLKIYNETSLKFS